MTRFRGDRLAFGRPGVEPHWTGGNKDGVGTAYSPSSYIWFTTLSGIITEIYCPTIDQAQVQSLQYIITDGKTFFHEEGKHLLAKTERMSDHVLGYRIKNYDPDGKYLITKEIIADTRRPCVLQHTKLNGHEEFISQLHLYAILAPHLQMGGWGNNAYVAEVAGREILVAEKKGLWLTMAATVPFRRLSCGYSGRSDGLQDIAENFQMDWEFDKAYNGNVALTGEIALEGKREFTLGVAFGNNLSSSITALFQSLAIPFEKHRQEYSRQWEAYCRLIMPLESASKDKGNLYFSSYSLILGHEDKTYPGAIIASLAIPWGEAKGDNELGGYHLVWVRDMYQAVTGLLAAGNTDDPSQALIYLAASQQNDGGFPQSFWITGEPYWKGIQLDEVSFPVILAWRLREQNLTDGFDAYPMVSRAISYLIRNGPATGQERWEESSGYSPSTLAVNIAALICAATFFRKHGDETTAKFLEEYADFLECHIEAWTVTTQGTLVPGIKRHYIRIHPVRLDDISPDEDPNHGFLEMSNHPPGVSARFPARDVIDPGFLELVRYGIRKPGDILIEDSLRVVDAVLKIETPFGPCWHRYNHDGYGQQEDGGPYRGWGKGRAWPLLVGERAHYEFAAGKNVTSLIKAMEQFASLTGMIPEQVWDTKDIPDLHLYLGRPTGSATPLVWAHAEYIKLLRSVADGRIFDMIPPVAERYISAQSRHQPREVWKTNRQPQSVPAGWPLRIQAPAPFRLRWTKDEWQTANDISSTPTSLGIEFADIEIPAGQESPIKFTFFWTAEGKWEGKDYTVNVTSPPVPQ